LIARLRGRGGGFVQQHGKWRRRVRRAVALIERRIVLDIGNVRRGRHMRHGCTSRIGAGAIAIPGPAARILNIVKFQWLELARREQGRASGRHDMLCCGKNCRPAGD
jgi:hypothetical protein